MATIESVLRTQKNQRKEAQMKRAATHGHAPDFPFHSAPQAKDAACQRSQESCAELQPSERNLQAEAERRQRAQSAQQAAAFALGQQAKRMNALKRAHDRTRKRRSREKGRPTPLHDGIVQGCLDDVVAELRSSLSAMKADNESLDVDLQQANAMITKSSSMTLTEGGHKGKHTRHNPERSDLMMQLIAIGAKKTTILPLMHAFFDFLGMKPDAVPRSLKPVSAAEAALGVSCRVQIHDEMQEMINKEDEDTTTGWDRRNDQKKHPSEDHGCDRGNS